MLAGKCYFFAFISERQWTTLKALVCDSSFGPAETFEFLIGLTMLVIHWQWYVADGTQKAISKTADSYRIATDVESIITTAGSKKVFKIALLVVLCQSGRQDR